MSSCSSFSSSAPIYAGSNKGGLLARNGGGDGDNSSSKMTAARMGCRAHMCIDISSSNFAARYAVFRCLLQRRGTVGLQRRGAVGLQRRGTILQKDSVGKSGSKRESMVRRLVVCALEGKEVYQPFRPPPVSVPASDSLSSATTTEEQLEILRERRGLWHEYAIIIPILSRAGFAPSMIDEATGMTGVEQNMIVVASQVRSSLKASGFDEEKLASFDVGGDQLLYELRILSTQQRKASAEFLLERKLGMKEANELARAVKDFGRRKGVEGWKDFTSAPGDCLAFACYRQSKEYRDEVDKETVLNKALDYAVSAGAKSKLQQALKRISGDNETSSQDEDFTERSHLQVFRLLEGEMAGAQLPMMLPIADATVKSLEEAPLRRTTGKGPFNVLEVDATSWKSWAALPGWAPIASSIAPVGVHFADSSSLPLQSNKTTGISKVTAGEPLLLVVDKGVTELDSDDSLFVVASEGSQELRIKAGSKIAESQVRSLGKVVIALRPAIPAAIPASEDQADWE
jgi:hypothetical protein